MSRFIGFLALSLLAAAPVAAGELDKEYGAKAPATPAITADDLPTTHLASSPDGVRTAGELDAETPTQACGWRRGFGFGYGRFGYGGLGGFGLGYGGFGLGGFGLGYGGFGLGYSSFRLGYGGLGYGYGLGGLYGGFGGYPYGCYGGWGGWGYW